MRTRAAVVAVLVIGAVGGALAVDATGVLEPGPTLAERWVSDTGVPVAGNHHTVAAGTADGEGLVLVPVSGEHGSDQCRVVALGATDGTQRWDRPVPREACNIHAVGSLELDDYDGDGAPEAIVPTGEERLYALDLDRGEPELTVELTAYGYSRPAVGELSTDGSRRIVVIDAHGTVATVRPDGSADWTHDGSSDVWASPAIVDVTGDGSDEVVVGFGRGHVTAFEHDGAVAWNRSLPDDGWLTWTATGEVDGTVHVVASTDAGGVHALGGADGGIKWTRSFGRLAAVGAIGDADGDGNTAVFVTAKDGRLRSLEASTGRTQWETPLAEEPGQMTPPPVTGDVDGDGVSEVVAVTNGGDVKVVDPADGRILASYSRSGPLPWSGESPPIWTHPTLADTDGDGADEIYVVYGDGRVAALEYVEG